MGESATLKEAPFVDGRIAIADPNPNASCVRLARDWGSRAAQPNGPGALAAVRLAGQFIPSPANASQTNPGKIAWIYLVLFV
jgi:hypothetical protein